ncbi:Ribose 5-phosphate isomerase [Halalkaliarchaeum sp. AArc-CO]|uniref:ribose-5-phosphate isomerase RpiA n=1 Tax=unclassified Halalkaliarchaeum TaxID=2678344 RepID=UPI00217EE185|nr:MULTISPECIES: ribose-5-phosphate isomerase RpiA [unclassified Halalkaliarchaeum]MDR5672650.1 ribose-5-phosphate isomerase RpiA [Halalkaliarchaeum sp. AArc-GB]UWG49445.1 Ribose 5-phosphate isomerase [Halalkaliarchaeum sp. AArc-CO]
MKRTDGTDAAKRAAGEAAAELVEDGTVVGLGTGSTAAFAIRAIGRRVDAGLDVRGVATSFAARELARDCGIPLVELPDVTGVEQGEAAGGSGIDLAIDGADQVADGDLIKGGGAAHAREKLVDDAADRFVVVVDRSKVADALAAPVPVEVLPDARGTVTDAVFDLGGEATLRTADRKDGPVVTDNGNLVLDCEFGRIDDPDALSARLSALPGVVEHGLFVGIADEVYVGDDGGDVDVLGR